MAASAIILGLAQDKVKAVSLGVGGGKSNAVQTGTSFCLARKSNHAQSTALRAGPGGSWLMALLKSPF